MHTTVGAGLREMAKGLPPFIDGILKPLIGDLSWARLLEERDIRDGRHRGTYSETDVALQLRVVSTHLGTLGYPFNGHLSRAASAWIKELIDTRNSWAHNERFTVQQAYRALDTMELLLAEVKSTTAMEDVSKLKANLLEPSAGSPLSQEGGPDSPTGDRAMPPLPLSVPNAPVSGPASATIMVRPARALSYAMAMNAGAVIGEIIIESAVEQRGASLAVDVVVRAGTLGDPKVHFIDLEPDVPRILDSVGLVLNPDAMLQIDDQQLGLVRAVLRDAAGAIIATAQETVQVLAHNLWMANDQLGLETLPAHVQPNAPVIAELLLEASDRLKESTGNSALNGYQGEDPTRVDAIVESIWDAMRARDIRYSEPPASWGMNGQKVRTPDEVLVGRLGTCLDTTVTLAAALELAGINSTMWLLQGHIALAYWRADLSLGLVASTDASEIFNQIGLGNLRPIETTTVTGGQESLSLERAVQIALDDNFSNPDGFTGVTDIRAARLAKVFPLPSRRENPDGTITVVEYQPPAARTFEFSFTGASREGAVETAPRRVQQWKNALLDLSLRNRLINFTDSAGLQLAVPERSVGRFEDIISDNVSITLMASDNVAQIDEARGLRFGRDLPPEVREALLFEKRAAYVDITSAAYAPRLRSLASKARIIAEETGSNNLYLAFGALHWKLEGRELRSPLVLVPVTLQTANRGASYKIQLDETGASTPNYCLLEKLRVTFGLQIPGLANPGEDASGIDLDGAFTAVRVALSESGLPFRVEDSASLAILQFAKFRLWKDLDDNWKALSSNPLVNHLIETPLDPFHDPVSLAADVDLDELGAVCPVPADSSQLDAIAEAVAGRTFVLEGPPGTGKSQTITNLLARALASGKRVLFVAEKRTALDVVKKRLDAVGLGALSLDLHDKGARPAAVRAQIQAALDLRARPDHVAFTTAQEAAASSRGALARYAQRLHEENSAGLSLYGARDRELAADRDIPPLPVPTSFVEDATEWLQPVMAVLRTLPDVADLARPNRRHGWGFIDEIPPARRDVKTIHAAAMHFDATLGAVEELGVSREQLAIATTPLDIQRWSEIASAPRFPIDGIDALQEPGRLSELAAVESAISQVMASSPDWRAQVIPSVFDGSAEELHTQAMEADAAGIFRRKKRRRAVLERLRPFLISPDQIALKSLSKLTGALVAAQQHATELRSSVGGLPVAISVENWNPWINEQSERIVAQLAWARWLAAAMNDDGTPLVGALRSFYTRTPAGHAMAELATLFTAWDALNHSAVDDAAATRWQEGSSFIATWSVTSSSRGSAVTLDRWLALVRHLEPLRSAGLLEARLTLLDGVARAEDAPLAFERGVALCSITERSEATTLSRFDAEAHNKAVLRFTHSIRTLRDELPQTIPAEVLAFRTFNSTAESGLMGGLRRQLQRQRGGMSVRALMENYGELISQILPCTLMSPESVARFFPARAGLFDLVVFDEASQVRVADAVGAMGRGNAVVVVGDSRQMPPTSFAEISVAVDDENLTNETVVDEESILTECVQARVPSKWLSWHYRSQDEALIAFSNRHYYDGRLSSFPAPFSNSSGNAGHGLRLVRVNGTFNRTGAGKALRTNQVEADAIVAEVKRRFAESPHSYPSLGVITFNAQQSSLIDNMLRDGDDDRIRLALDDPDGLFIKNLENVQGHERDAILFSVAFSANARGDLPLNFGPVTRAGGERRLNVAITRARREVVLFASFDPSDLRSEETSSVGIKHLKAYLEMAQRGTEAAATEVGRIAVVDRHREDIAAELRFLGYAVRTDLGLSDFRVDISVAHPDSPDEPIVAILLDGPVWRERRTVADRDGLPVDVLKHVMRWPGVERVWLPEWLSSREATLARLESAITAARTGPAPTEEVATESSAPIVEPELRIANQTAAPSQPPTRHPDLGEFVAWPTPFSGTVDDLDRIHGWSEAQRVEKAIRSAVAAEGPISPPRLARLVANSFGLGRVAESRVKAILERVPEELKRNDAEGFLWPDGSDPASWHVAREASPLDSRVLEEVALEEIVNAFRIVAQGSGGMNEEELFRAGLAVFGGVRVTAGIRERLEKALALGLDGGSLIRSPEGIYKAQ